MRCAREGVGACIFVAGDGRRKSLYQVHEQKALGEWEKREYDREGGLPRRNQAVSLSKRV